MMGTVNTVVTYSVHYLSRVHSTCPSRRDVTERRIILLSSNF